MRDVLIQYNRIVPTRTNLGSVVDHSYDGYAALYQAYCETHAVAPISFADFIQVYDMASNRGISLQVGE